MTYFISCTNNSHNFSMSRNLKRGSRVVRKFGWKKILNGSYELFPKPSNLKKKLDPIKEER